MSDKVFSTIVGKDCDPTGCISKDIKLWSTSWFDEVKSNWSEWLKDLKGKENLRYLEVGSWEGKASLWLVDNIMAKNCRLYCLDTWFGNEDGREFSAGIYNRFQHNLKEHIDSGMIIPVIGDSRYTLPTLSVMMQNMNESPFIFAYIDGSHRAQDVLSDMIMAWSLLWKGGIMICDDYGWDMKNNEEDNPRVAIDCFLKCFKGEYEIIGKNYQVCLRKIHKFTEDGHYKE